MTQESNLKVPAADPADGSAVKKKHGAAFGRGIYTCPDYKMAKEDFLSFYPSGAVPTWFFTFTDFSLWMCQDFSYGASATFACLALTGRQLTRHHGKEPRCITCSLNHFERFETSNQF